MSELSSKEHLKRMLEANGCVGEIDCSSREAMSAVAILMQMIGTPEEYPNAVGGVAQIAITLVASAKYYDEIPDPYDLEERLTLLMRQVSDFVDNPRGAK